MGCCFGKVVGDPIEYKRVSRITVFCTYIYYNGKHAKLDSGQNVEIRSARAPCEYRTSPRQLFAYIYTRYTIRQYRINNSNSDYLSDNNPQVSANRSAIAHDATFIKL